VHNNYFLLRKLSSDLENRLSHAIISECFTQNKEELIIRFETSEGTFFIKASLQASFSCLSFPERYDRARKNSVDIFEDIVGQRVEGIRQFMNERSFAIQCSNNLSLLFKMHGIRSNVILFRMDNVDAVFKNNLKQDLGLKLGALDRQIDWSYENFVRHQSDLPLTYFTFGKVVWKYLDELNFYSFTAEEQWSRLQDLLQVLHQPTYYITQINGRITFSLVPLGDLVREHKYSIEALNDFFLSFTQHDTFGGEKSAALMKLSRKLRMRENYYKNIFQKMIALQKDHNYKVWADLVMANLHAIEPGSEHVTLLNFYDENRPAQIKLKKHLSPVKNAELFYAKSKNQQLEITRLQQSLVSKEKEVATLKDQIQQLETIHDTKNLRTMVLSMGLIDPSKKKTESLPYHEFEYKTFKILVGKNSQSNDKLTLKHSYKEDLWLHAKDVAGSHVLIKHQAGKKFPKDVIERAAQLAAYNSKRKNESLCPVIFTPRKYVRKRKGDPAGAVIVEREETILVEPKLN